MLLGTIVTYTLNPLVTWLEAIRVPRVIGTIIEMASAIGALMLGTYSLHVKPFHPLSELLGD